MAFTDMLKNQSMGGREAGVAKTAPSGGSYGNEFLGTFANLILGDPQQGDGQTTFGLNPQAGGRLNPTDPNYPIGGYDATGKPIYQTSNDITTGINWRG